MAKTSSVEKNNRAARWPSSTLPSARAQGDRDGPVGRSKSASPRSSSSLRCRAIRQEPHPQPLRSYGPSACYYRKLKLSAVSRCASWATKGLIPGMVKSSW
jgi:hypothetical protein